VAKDYLLTFLSDDDVGVQYANTICVHDDELGGPRPGNEILDDIESWLKTKYTNFLPSSMTLRKLRLFQIPATYGDDSNVYEQGLTQVGALSIGTGTVPRESSATLTLRSSHTSRRKMGRLLLPGPRNPSMVNANGTWVTSGSYYTNIATFADALLAGKDMGIGGVDGHLSTRVYSRVAHIQGVGDKTTDINAYTIQPRVRWLRRRVTAP